MQHVGWMARAAIVGGLLLSGTAIGSVLVEDRDREPVVVDVSPAFASPSAPLPLPSVESILAARPSPDPVEAPEDEEPAAPQADTAVSQPLPDETETASFQPHEPGEDATEGGELEELPLQPAPKPIERTIEVGRGDTLMDLLVAHGIERREAYVAVTELQKVFDPRRLKVGQLVTLTFQSVPETQDAYLFQAVSLEPAAGHRVFARRSDDGGFASGEEKQTLYPQTERFTGVIDSSLFEAASAAGLPINTLIEMIRAYSYDVDFQRDIRPGDGFEVAVRRFYDADGNWMRDGEMIFARLTLSGKDMPIYRWVDAKGDADYYNAKGESVRKALLRTPVDGYRISSRYGKRRHPILGYNKMHKGIDFAAPTGTPIMAAGDGVVEKAGRWGGYGNYVRIRHSDKYSTAYAHLSRFARGIRAGKKVKQGQVIGYVGSTGRSTGPHLHYEILVHNNQVNPLSVKFAPGKKLKGAELDSFRTARVEIDRAVAALPDSARIASAGGSTGM